MDSENPQGLGDVVARAFASVGITTERAQRFANAIGLDDCGCCRRREALNALFPFAAADQPPQTIPGNGGDRPGG
jgi:hypothetical protein